MKDIEHPYQNDYAYNNEDNAEEGAATVTNLIYVLTLALPFPKS
jgi:hypothetical protein